MCEEDGKKKFLGEVLIEKGIISEVQLEQALAEQENSMLRLGEQLVQMGLVTENEIILTLAEMLGVPTFKTDQVDEFPISVINTLSYEYCKENKVIPVAEDEETNTVSVVHHDPLNVFIVDEIEQRTGMHVKFLVDTPASIERALAKLRRFDSSEMDAVVNDMQTMDVRESKADQAVQLDNEAEGPIVTLVNRILATGIQEGCSDIHVEPSKSLLRIRFRKSGVLCELTPIPDLVHKFQPQLISRLKLMADMDISERRLPQDGRIKVAAAQGKTLDMRVNTLPVQSGEKICMRILDTSAASMGLNEMGLSKRNSTLLRRNCQKPNGLVLVSGPTGSGKTTTLYASLNYINSPEVNICTTEDPVEYTIPDYNQTNIRSNIGLTFPSALRALLRQDPDIILVGEMRDGETANIGVEAAMTGHLVFSTIHTNSASGAVGRLVQMGVPPYLVASTILCVCAQGLMRTLCQSCRKKAPLSKELLLFSKRIKANLDHGYDAVGCKRCQQSGYKGRMGVHEVLENSQTLRQCIVDGLDEKAIEEVLVKQGWVTQRMDGMLKVLQGQTSEDEMNRVCR